MSTADRRRLTDQPAARRSGGQLTAVRTVVGLVAATLAALAALTACSTVSRDVQLEKEAAIFSSPLKRAEDYFRQGELFLGQGDLIRAKFYFDQTIDLLLDSGSQDPGRNAVLNDYVTKISSLELNYLKDKSDQDTGQQSFLEEVIASPLFPPSAQDVIDLQEKLKAADSSSYSIPLVVNSQVVSFIKAFQNIRHESIQNAIHRSVEYIDRFKEILRKYEIPEDLAYLPLIESGFRVNAISRARAKGIWQFIASTARLFGLRVDWMVDERLDPIKSCEAAAQYMRYLYGEYQDWYLVLACYNGGPGRIGRAINRLQTKDFFEINQTRYIRRETRNYVPAFLAALIIAKSPGEFGFETGAGSITASKMVSVPSPISLNRAADALGLALEELKELNPELVTDYTPTDVATYSLRVPPQADEAALANLERVPLAKIPSFNFYTVRRGDSLFSISRRFHVAVARLKKANRMKTNLIRPGRRLLIPRGPY